MFPRWLSFAFLAMVAYIAYSASQIPSPVPVVGHKPITAKLDAEKYPVLIEMADVEGWKRKLNPDYAAVMNCTLDKQKTKNDLKFSAVEQAAGEGAGAPCGETITVALTVWDSKGTQVFTGEVPLALGSRQVASGLDFGLLGIKVGGERTLTLPPYASTRGKPSAAHDKISKALPKDTVSVVQVKRLK